MNNTATLSLETPLWREYWALCKGRVVALMLVTSVVGMILATPTLPSFQVLILGNIGIAFAAFSAAAINHIVDRRIDTMMARTARRPVATGRITPLNAFIFAILLGVIGMAILVLYINMLTAILSFITLMGYAVFYTLYLKRATPQNIVIGGAAGAAPPLLGWVAVTGHVDPYSLLLVLIIFAWTPPHFWALSIAKEKEYAKAQIPMLPVTHGIPFTKLCVFLYTILLTLVTTLPYLTGMSGLFYFVTAMALNAIFLGYAYRLYQPAAGHAIAMKTFAFSIVYLFVLFIGLLVDHYFIWH